MANPGDPFAGEFGDETHEKRQQAISLLQETVPGSRVTVIFRDPDSDEPRFLIEGTDSMSEAVREIYEVFCKHGVYDEAAS